MTTCLVAFADGRLEYEERSWASLREMMPPTDYEVVVNDHAHELGFDGAIRAGWDLALQTDAEWVVGMELDFTFRLPVPLNDMIGVLRAHPHLVQMALLRQPWSPEEREVGGIIQQRPETYTRRSWDGHAFIEHANFTTTNVAVWPRWVVERGWPRGRESEGRFGLALFAEDSERRAAFWGDGSVWIDHIGDVRSGHGY